MAEPAGGAEEPRKRPDLAGFYAPAWRSTAPPRPLAPGDLAEDRRRRLRVLLDGCGLGEGIAGSLAAEGREITT